MHLYALSYEVTTALNSVFVAAAQTTFSSSYISFKLHQVRTLSASPQDKLYLLLCYKVHHKKISELNHILCLADDTFLFNERN